MVKDKQTSKRQEKESSKIVISKERHNLLIRNFYLITF